MGKSTGYDALIPLRKETHPQGWRWGTVIGTNPVTVHLDNDPAGVYLPADTPNGPPLASSRVWCQLVGTGLAKRVIIVAGPLPARIQELAQQVSDFNNAEYDGWYRGNNAANAPSSGSSWHYVHTIRHDSSYQVQTAYTYFAGNESVHTRWKSGGVWGAWRQTYYDSGWTPVTSFGTGYSAYSGYTAQMRVKNGILYGTGLITVGGSAPTTDNSVICTVPFSMNFSVKRHLVANTNNGFAAVALRNNDFVRSGTTAYTSWLSLDGLATPIP